MDLKSKSDCVCLSGCVAPRLFPLCSSHIGFLPFFLCVRGLAHGYRQVSTAIVINYLLPHAQNLAQCVFSGFTHMSSCWLSLILVPSSYLLNCKESLLASVLLHVYVDLI